MLNIPILTNYMPIHMEEVYHFILISLQQFIVLNNLTYIYYVPIIKEVLFLIQLNTLLLFYYHYLQ